MLKRWSLNAKIILVLSVLILGSVVISTTGIQKMNELNGTIDVLVQQTASNLDKAHDLKELFLIQVINEKNTAVEEDPVMIKTLQERTASRDHEIKKLLENWNQTASAQVKEGLKEFSALYDLWWKNTSEIQELAFSKQHKKAYELSKNAGRELRLKGETICDQLINQSQKAMAEEDARTDQIFAHGRNLMILTSLIAIMIGLTLAFFIMRAVSRSINHVIENLSNNSNEVTTAAMQIAASSEELSQAATEQATALEQTAAAIEQMNSMIQKNAENARQTSDLVVNSKNSAENGKSSVGEMVDAIREINESNNQMKEVVNVISEIGAKTKIINDIVFQTKLLSFNASVEAARAGEHGKGFAVVAEEVGNLAQVSGNAAKEISTLLESSVQKVHSLIQENQRKVESGTQVASRCGGILDIIVENVSTVTRMASEISSACQEQAQGIREISKAMGQLEQVTQSNSTSSEEAASAAEELSGQSESLRSMVGILVQTIQGYQAEQALQLTAGQKLSAPKTIAKKDNVVQIKQKTAAKAIGRMNHDLVPSQDDPRFEEV